MKRVKACLNSQCVEYRKTYYKETDVYCVKCGNKLNYVCKHYKCYKQIPDDVDEQYCPIHLAEREDKIEKRKETAKKVGVFFITAGSIALAAGKTVIDKIPKK